MKLLVQGHKTVSFDKTYDAFLMSLDMCVLQEMKRKMHVSPWKLRISLGLL